METADERGTRVVGGVPVGVDRTIPQADDHVAKLCATCLDKHVTNSDHPFKVLSEEQRADFNRVRGKPNEFEGPSKDDPEAAFRTSAKVGESSSSADKVKTNVRGAAAAARDKLKEASSEED